MKSKICEELFEMGSKNEVFLNKLKGNIKMIFMFVGSEKQLVGE